MEDWIERARNALDEHDGALALELVSEALEAIEHLLALEATAEAALAEMEVGIEDLFAKARERLRRASDSDLS